MACILATKGRDILHVFVSDKNTGLTTIILMQNEGWRINFIWDVK